MERIQLLDVLPFDQLFKFRIIYQIIIGIQEILLLLYCFIRSSTFQQKIAGIFLLLSFSIRVISGIIIIRQQCKAHSRKYSIDSHLDWCQSKNSSFEKQHVNNSVDKIKINIEGFNNSSPQRERYGGNKLKSAIKQLIVLSPQIVAKLTLLYAMLQAQNISLILFLNYFYDEKTFIYVGARKLLDINQLIINVIIKLFPFTMLIVIYFKESSSQNGEIGYSVRKDDLFWFGFLAVFYFFSDQFYYNASQKIKTNDCILQYIHLQQKQNSAWITDSFLNNFYISQGNAIQSIQNRNHHRLNYNGINSQILAAAAVGRDSQQLANRSPNKKKSGVLKKNLQNFKSGITAAGDMPADQYNAKSFESSIDDIQDSMFFKDILGLVPQGLAIINSQNKVLFTNSKILELLECEREQVLKVVKGLSTQMNPHNSNGSIHAASGQYPIRASNTLNQQPSYNNARNSISQFATKKHESNFENILTSPYIHDDQGIQMSKQSQIQNENNPTNSISCSNFNLQAPSSSLKNCNNPKQNSQNSQILDDYDDDKLQDKGAAQEQEIQTFHFKQKGNNKNGDEFENEMDDNARMRNQSQKIIQQSHSPHSSHLSIDILDHKYKQSTGKFGGYNSDLIIDTMTGNLKNSLAKDQYKNKQQSIDSKYKLKQSLSLWSSSHAKTNCNGIAKANQNGNSKNAYTNLKGDQENQQQSDKDSNQVLSEQSESDNLGMKENDKQSKANKDQGNGNLKECKLSGYGERQVENDNNKSSDGIMASDVSKYDDKSFQNGSAHYLKTNQVSQNNFEEVVNNTQNLEISKNYFECNPFDNIVSHSDNQFVSIHNQSKFKEQTGTNPLNKFNKNRPSSGQIQQSNNDLINRQNNNLVNINPIKPQNMNNNNSNNNNNIIQEVIYENVREEHGHNHILKKQIKKQISIFTPQLKQRNIKVGQLISNMFDHVGNGGDEARTYGGGGGLKKSNSKNHLITQLSEAFESNYSRNHSLLGQINGNRNIGFYQYSNNESSMQVMYRGKSLVVRLIPCEYQWDLKDNHSHPSQDQSLVLIQVEPFWEELFQAKIDDFSKNKMQLFGSLCHELRTPLNCSISFLDLYKQLKDGTDEQPDVNEFIEPSLRSNQLMLNMVNDILDFVQMTDNKFKFNPIQFNLIELLQECLVLIKIHADIKNITLQLKNNDSLPKFIVSDPNRIRQIILNFLSNSLKFTKKCGTIQIEANSIDSGIVSASKLSSVIRISVHDTGIGISKQNQRKIFEVFNKTDHKDSSINPNGCGIGLPLSNSLARLIGPSQPIFGMSSNGQQIQFNSGIQVESIEGQGSTFSFLIQDLNSKLQQQSRDFRESCDISDQADIEQIQPNNDTVWKSVIQDVQHIPHLKITQEVAGGLQIYHFQQSQPNQFQYRVESITDTRLKTIQSSVLRSSNRTNDVNVSGTLSRVPSILLPKSQRRMIEGFRKTTSDMNDTRQISNSQHLPTQKLQSQQVFTACNSPNITQLEGSGNNSPINIVKSYNKINPPLMQHSQDIRNDVKNLLVSNLNNNLNSFPQIKNMNSQSQFTHNTLDFDLQSLKHVIQLQNTQQQIPTQNISQSQNTPKQQPSQNTPKQQQSQSTPKQQSSQNTPKQQAMQNTPPQQLIQSMPASIAPTQIQTKLLDKNNFSQNSRGEETKILIADDSGFNIMVLKKIIQYFHIQNISICHDGVEAVAKVHDIANNQEERLYDIIFMDLEMPIMNGYEACKQIKQMIHNYQLPDISIVACSAYGIGVKEEPTFHISQMDDAIVKPIKKDQICTIFQTFLRDKPSNL